MFVLFFTYLQLAFKIPLSMIALQARPNPASAGIKPFYSLTHHLLSQQSDRFLKLL